MIENETQKTAVLEAKLEHPIHVWIGIDTGMHRLGFPPDKVQSIFSQLEHSSNICSTIVVASHFACADDLSSSKTIKQQNTFKKCVDSTVPDGSTDLQLSIANSAAILAWPDTHFDWQRPGYMLYGNSPFTNAQVNADKLTPAMTFKSAVISLRNIGAGESVGYTSNWTANRPSSIATITVGYGDGYPRHAPNGTPVLINNIRCPLVGRVSMDMITVDVTDQESVKIGDEVTLWGPDLSVNEIAYHCDTIGYELLTRMPSRVPRTYIN
jgi:alanine racemase